MKKHTLYIIVVFYLFSCKQKDIEPYEKKDIIKELLISDWTVDKVGVEMKVEDWAVPFKGLAENIIVSAIRNEVEDDVLRITDEKACCYRENTIYPSNYRIAGDTLFFEDTELLGFPIPHILIYQDSLKQDKMISYLNKDEIVSILIDMGETQHIDLIESNVKEARCNLVFKRAEPHKYDSLFISLEQLQ